MIQGHIEDVSKVRDFETMRALVEALNIRITLAIEPDGEKALDIHWCLKEYRVAV